LSAHALGSTSLCLAGVGGLAALLRWPPLGLVVLVVGSLAVPFAVGTGTKTDLNFPLLFVPFLMLLWLPSLIRRGRSRIFSARAVPPLLAFVATAVLSFAVANQPWVFIAPVAPLRAQLGGMGVFVLSAGAFLLATDYLQDLRWLQVLTAVFLAVGAVHLADCFVPGLDLPAGLQLQTGAGGSLFWTWLVAMAFSQGALNRQLNVVCRLVLGAMVVAALYIGLMPARTWLSGWAPPLVAIVATLWAATPRLALPVTVLGGLGAAAQLPTVVDFVLDPGNRYSLMTRVEAWRVLSKVIATSPALGLGPANYYHATPLFPILGWYVKFSSHNTYVDIIAQTGLIGFACFVWFVWEVARLGWHLRARVPKGFASAYVNGAIGGLAGTLAAGMLGDWLLPFVYNVGLSGFRASVLGWLFLGGLVAIDQGTRTTAEPA
jgi:hypothetical protein